MRGKALKGEKITILKKKQETFAEISEQSLKKFG